MRTQPVKQVGPFRIIEELDHGGMAVVYRAAQPSVGGRIVALKVLPEYKEHDQEAIARFRREAEVAAQLFGHPNIVKVLDASLEEPPYYIAMEFLPGGSLKRRLRNAPLPLDEAISIIAQVCSALDYAHSRGVVHRDIKPENVLFADDGRAVVTDFGIVQVSGKTRVTIAGTRLGTPEYMSPEQAKGLRTDYRSDLYSAAALFYEMVTGYPPFSGPEPLVVMKRICEDPVRPPSKINRRLPRALDRVLLKALAKAPGERYQSGAEFVAALRQATATSPPHPRKRAPKRKQTKNAQPRPTARKAHSTSPRALEPLLSVALAVVVTVILAVAGYAAWIHQWRWPQGGSNSQGSSAQVQPPTQRPPGSAPATSTLPTGSVAPSPEKTPAGTEPEPVPSEVKVPSVVNMTLSDAKKVLMEQGFEIEAIRSRPSKKPKDTVLTQWPRAGELVSVTKRKISLRISAGPIAKVPNLRGLTVDKAKKKLLEEYGLNIHAKPREDKQHDEGTIIDQDPRPGTEIDIRSTDTVTIYYAKPPKKGSDHGGSPKTEGDGKRPPWKPSDKDGKGEGGGSGGGPGGGPGSGSIYEPPGPGKNV